jgi:hypothetical protein
MTFSIAKKSKFTNLSSTCELITKSICLVLTVSGFCAGAALAQVVNLPPATGDMGPAFREAFSKGTTVQLDAGIYLHAGALDVPNGKTLRGAGANTIVRSTTAPEGAIRLGSSCTVSDLTVEYAPNKISGNFVLDTLEDNPNYAGISAKGASNVLISSVTTGMVPSDALTFWSSSNIRVQNCHIGAATTPVTLPVYSDFKTGCARGIGMISSKNISITGTSVQNAWCAPIQGDSVSSVNLTNDHVITGFIFFYGGTNIAVRNSTLEQAYLFEEPVSPNVNTPYTISGNHFSNGSIVFTYYGSPTISNNDFNNSSLSMAESQGASITSNTFENLAGQNFFGNSLPQTACSISYANGKTTIANNTATNLSGGFLNTDSHSVGSLNVTNNTVGNVWTVNPSYLERYTGLTSLNLAYYYIAGSFSAASVTGNVDAGPTGFAKYNIVAPAKATLSGNTETNGNLLPNEQ